MDETKLMTEREASFLEEIMGGQDGVIDSVEDVLLWEPKRDGIVRLFSTDSLDREASKERYERHKAMTADQAAIVAINQYIRYCRHVGRLDLAVALAYKAREFAPIEEKT
jgi:hypothetical protein